MALKDRAYRPQTRSAVTQASMSDLAYLVNPAGKSKDKAGNVTFEAKDTSHITTGPESEAMLDSTSGSATTLLNSPAGEYLQRDERARAEDIEQSGWSRALGGVMSALEFIDRGRKVISLAARDVGGFDENRGEEITLGDYGKVLTGKSHELVDTLGEDLVGRDGQLTFSSMLDRVWEQDDDDPFWDKALRGVVSFGGDVALDPLTYVTFGAGGAGTKASIAAVDATITKAGTVAAKRVALGIVDDVAETGMERILREAIEKALPANLKLVANYSAEHGLAMSDDAIRQWAIDIGSGARFVTPEGDIVRTGVGFVKRTGEGVISEGHGVVGQKIMDVSENVANRNFGTLKSQHADYIDHVFTRRTGNLIDPKTGRAVMEKVNQTTSRPISLEGVGRFGRLGEAFTVGGMRLSTPVGVRSTSKPLMRTVGAFEEWHGLKLLHKIPQSKVGKGVSRVMPFVDAGNPYIQVARRRFDEADSPWQALNITELNWASQQKLKAGLQASNDIDLAQTFRSVDNVSKAMNKVGMADDVQAAVWAELTPSIAQGRLSAVALNAVKGLPEEAQNELLNAQKGFSRTLANSLGVIRKYSNDPGAIDNYTPIVFTQKFQRMMKQIGEVGPVWDGRDLEAGAAKLSKLLPDGEEISADELALFMEAYESLQRTATGAARVGEAGVLHRRRIGRYLRNLDDGVDSRVVMSDFRDPTRAFADQTSMNETLSKVARAVAEDPRYDKALKWADDSEAFVTDPVKLLNDYVAEVASVAEQRQFLESAKQVGAASRHTEGVNVDHLLHNVGPLVKQIEDRLREFADNRGIEIEAYLAAPENLTTVHLGMGATIDLPEEVAESRQMQRVIGKLKKQFGRLERSQANFAQARARKVERLVRNGMDEDLADRVATMTDPALRELRAEYRAVVEEEYVKLEQTYLQAWAEASLDGRSADEALESLRAHRRYVTEKVQGTFDSVETQYNKQMRDTLPYEAKVRETVLDPDDPVTYAAYVAQITDPIRQQLDDRQGRILETLHKMVEDVQDAKIARIAKEDARLEKLRVKRYKKYEAQGLTDSQIEARERDVLRDRNALYDKPEAGQVGKAYQAELMAYDDEMDYLWPIIDAVANANAVDDDLGIIAKAQAQRVAAGQQARAIWTMWDSMVNEGIVARRATNPKIADEVDRLWNGRFVEDANGAHMREGVRGRYEVIVDKDGNYQGGFAVLAREGKGSIAQGQLDNPHFWTIVADGVEEDWKFSEEILKTQKKFWTDSDGNVMYPGEHISRQEVIEIVESRIARAEATVESYGRLRATRKANVETMKAARQDVTIKDAEVRALREEYLPEDLARVHRDVATGVDDAEELAVAKLERLRADYETLAGGTADEQAAVARGYVIEKMTGILQAQVAHGDLKAEGVMAGLQVGDSFVNNERAFMVLAQAANDPAMREELGWAVDIVNRELRRLPGNNTLTIGENGLPLLTQTGAYRQNKIDLRNVIEMVKSGQITRDQLKENGLGYINAIFDVDAELVNARAAANQASGKTLRDRQKAQLAIDSFDDFVSLVEGVVNGERTAVTLRNWVMEGTSTGTTRESRQFKRILDVLPAEKQDEVRRLVQAAYFADERVSPQGRALLAFQDEEKYQRILFRPIQDSFDKVDELTAAARAAKEATQNKELRAYYDNVEKFSRALSMVDEYRLPHAPTGTRVEVPVGDKAAEKMQETLVKALRGLKKHMERLETDGPLTFESLMGETVELGAEQRGFTSREVKDFYDGVERAIDNAGASLSAEGKVRPAALSLSGVVGDFDLDPMLAVIFRNMIDGQKALYSPEGMGQLRNTFRTFMQGWRSNATVARPNFHFRNMLSGIANGTLVGVGPNDYRRLIPEYFRYRQALHQGATVDEAYNVLSPRYRQVFAAADAQGVMATGFVRGDLAARHAASGTNLLPYSPRFAPSVAGGKVMESMEDVMRLAVFAKYLDPNWAPESAAFAREMTMMVHFDYQDLTYLERRFKTIAPFFIWTRRNVPLQLKTLMEHPGNLQMYHHFSQAMNDNFGSDEYFDSPLPNFYGALAMPLGIDARDGDDNWARFVFDPELPMSNLEDLPLLDRDEPGWTPINIEKTLSPAAWINYVSEQMGPQISLPVDMLFAEREGDYQTNAPTGLNELGLFLENIDYFLGTELINADGTDWRWSGTQKKLFDSALPFFKDYTGGIENTPSRGSRFGLTDETGYTSPSDIGTRMFAEIMAGVAGGGGLKLQTPDAARSESYEATQALREMGGLAKVRAGNNPFTPDSEGAPNPADVRDWLNSLTNGG